MMIVCISSYSLHRYIECQVIEKYNLWLYFRMKLKIGEIKALTSLLIFLTLNIFFKVRNFSKCVVTVLCFKPK